MRGMMALTRTTNDYNVALEHTGTLTDFAAATGMDLEQAAVVLGRAYNGDTAALGRYGIKLKEGIKGQEVMAEISKRFAGQAEAQTNTLDGAYKRLKNSMDDLAENGGKNMAPFFSVMINEWLIPAVKWWTRLTGQFKDMESNMAIRGLSEDLKLYNKHLEKAEKEHDKLIKKYGETSIKARVAGEAVEYNKDKIKSLQLAIAKAKHESIEFTKAQHEVGNAAVDAGDKVSESATKVESYEDKVNKAADDIMSKAQEQAGIIAPLVTGVTQALLDNQMSLNEKMSSILKTGLYTILDVISLQIKAYIAAEAAKAVATGGLTAGTVVATTSQLVAVEALRAAVGTIQFADGGVVTRATAGIFGEAGPEAVLPLDRIQPIVNKAVQSSLTTNVGGVTVMIQTQKLDDNTNFDGVAVKIDKALKKLNRQRGV
jgi:hypothetical protein